MSRISLFPKRSREHALGRRTGRFSRYHQNDIAARLDKIANNKFPNSRHIKHDGYKILSKAHIAIIGRNTLPPRFWPNLIDDARKIPNTSDRAFVLGNISVVMPREGTNYKKVFEEAQQIVESIPVSLEKMLRYRHLANNAIDIDKNMAKRLLDLALKVKVEGNEEAVEKAQKEIMEMAYGIDQDFAASLASTLDNDPAHLRINRRIEIQKLKTKMENQLEMEDNIQKERNIDFEEAAKLALGSLNAGRIGTVSFDHTREFIVKAAELPIDEAYSVLSWVIENAVIRFKNTNFAKDLLKKIYDAIISSVELSSAIAFRSSKIAKRAINSTFVLNKDASIVVQPGERENALQFIRTWFEQNVNEYLKICDPYFGLEELEILKLLASVNPHCRISILTSMKHQVREKISIPLEDAYRTYWHARISEQNPPDTEIVIVGIQSNGDSPIHDRWWITKNSGLRLGTSFNSLGAKVSDISTLSPEEVITHEAQIDQFFERKKRDINGQKVNYTLFNL